MAHHTCSLYLSLLGLSSGPHSLAAVIVDPTPWVRDEAARASLMTSTVSWAIDVEESCIGDLDGSGAVNIDDLLAVISAFGSSEPSGDANGDGQVDADDLLAILAGWGGCP